MKASFHTLFRRRERENQSPQEVFAVAATAFCLKHDENFRKQFLNEFCEVPIESCNLPVTIAADDDKWGDLVVENNDALFVCVLEFKIRAEIGNHQNPAKQEFSYATKIRERYPNHKVKRFVLVTNEMRLFPMAASGSTMSIAPGNLGLI